MLRKKLSLEKITKEVNGKKYIAYVFCVKIVNNLLIFRKNYNFCHLVCIIKGNTPKKNPPEEGGFIFYPKGELLWKQKSKTEITL